MASVSQQQQYSCNVTGLATNADGLCRSYLTIRYYDASGTTISTTQITLTAIVSGYN